MARYQVPAVERAHAVLELLAEEPARLRLIDLASRLEIHKSSMFSLLTTLEKLGWVRKEKDGTYSLGPAIGILGASYFRQFNLLQSFHQEAPRSVERIGETAQLAMRDGTDVVYLAKEETTTPIRLVSRPGMRFPAHATSLGKVLLTELERTQFEQLYPERTLPALTGNTLTDREALWRQLEEVRALGYACDEQEAVAGFCCVAAPVFDHAGEMIAAVSFTMLETHWSLKKGLAVDEIVQLAKRLSRHAGYGDPKKG